MPIVLLRRNTIGTVGITLVYCRVFNSVEGYHQLFGEIQSSIVEDVQYSLRDTVSEEDIQYREGTPQALQR